MLQWVGTVQTVSYPVQNTRKKVQKLPLQKNTLLIFHIWDKWHNESKQAFIGRGMQFNITTCFGNIVFQQVNHKRPTSESHLLHKHLLKHHHIQQILMNWELSKGTFTWVVAWFSGTCCWSALDSLQLTLLWFTGWKKVSEAKLTCSFSELAWKTMSACGWSLSPWD